MEGKFTFAEKVILLVTLITMIFTVIIKMLTGVNDPKTVIAYGIIGLIIYVILLVAALFPATWRMTDSQKSEIYNVDQYQDRYRLLIVLLNLIVCIFFDIVMFSIK